jgi:hypothetical protein
MCRQLNGFHACFFTAIHEEAGILFAFGTEQQKGEMGP